MASSSTSLQASSSSSTQQWKYDVFLNFRGEDTRHSFTSHLEAALSRNGINTFKDDQLRRGEKISPALPQAIEESRFSIIIFSENYASSSWCLDELTKILECVKEGGHTALPVFHNVDPSHVREQKGSLAEAFAKHEQENREKMEKVVKDESKVIEEIVTRILTEQIHASSSNMDSLVGMDSSIKDMASLLRIGSDDVQIVGIWGMAGIGKTSIAEAVYEQIYAKFEGCCFLRNVREDSQRYGINFIKARLHSRKVLIVLDDVDNQQQLKALAGNHDWFGLGSRIIITTRNQQLLISQEVKAIYEVKELKYDEARMLFCQYAFRYKRPTKDFMQLCDQAVDYTGGLPLALKVLGSCLHKKDIDVWKSELDKLKQFSNIEVQNVLKTSFEGLDDNEQNIFLDIAFFYKGHHKDYVKDILNSCGFFFDTGIESLQDKSLITISKKNKLWMHDLLQEMGWNIVRQKSEVPGERSRLRVHEDINHVLATNTGTEAVKGIFLDLSASEELNFSVEAFAMLKGLRLLRVYNVQIDRSLEYLSEKELIAHTHDIWERRSYAWTRMEYLYTQCKLHLYGDFKFLSNNLRSLYWDGYPLKSLPSNFHPENLVELNMCFSQLKQLWEGKKAFKKLKFIKLSHSQHLTKTPDFSGAPNLSRLILEGCTSLVEVHPSIGALKKLIFLNLEGCKKLESFSSNIHMQSLQILTLSGCLKLKKFPELQGNMEHLPELSLEGTAIKGLPSSIEYLTGLASLNLKECKSLESLPSSVFKLKSLKTLILSNCIRLKKLPEIQENIERSMELFLDGSGIRELPSSIGRLNGLVLLNLKNCKKLAGLPQGICELTSLRTLILCGCSELKELPDDLGSLQCLVELKADGTGIQEVPPSINLLTNLQELSLEGCLYSSTKLNLSDCNLLGALPIDLSSLSSLESLDLSRNSFITIPASLISGLSRLKALILTYCKSLQSLPELPSSTEYLNAEDCTSLETFSCSSSACTSKRLGGLRLKFSNCFRLMENEHNDSVKHILLGIQLLASLPKFLGPDMSINGRDCPQNQYDAIVPGSRIPEWFVDQSTGSSVTVELPPHWYNTKLMGMAVCAVVGAKGVNDPATEKHCPRINFTVDGSSGLCLMWTAYLSPSMRADHTWFGYRSLVLLTAYRGLFGKSRGSMVCGVRLVYEGEEKDSDCSFPCGVHRCNSSFNCLI
ncbi:hypothetical protein AAG906_035753 [Vitis piasezkii]